MEDAGDRTFVATEVYGHDLVTGTEIRLTISADHLSVRAGCNTLMGAATWDDDILRAPQLASTMMACEPDRMEQDKWLGDFLASSPAWKLSGQTLTLGDTSRGLVLVATATGSRGDQAMPESADSAGPSDNPATR